MGSFNAHQQLPRRKRASSMTRRMLVSGIIRRRTAGASLQGQREGLSENSRSKQASSRAGQDPALLYIRRPSAAPTLLPSPHPSFLHIQATSTPHSRYSTPKDEDFLQRLRHLWLRCHRWRSVRFRYLFHVRRARNSCIWSLL